MLTLNVRLAQALAGVRITVLVLGADQVAHARLAAVRVDVVEKFESRLALVAFVSLGVSFASALTCLLWE